MKFEFNAKYNTIAAYSILVLTIVAVIVAALLRIEAIYLGVQHRIHPLPPAKRL